MSVKGNLRIKVEGSHLKASLLFQPDPDGREWDAASIGSFLTHQGIVEGVDERAIDDALLAFGESVDAAGGEPVQHVIAQGKPPVPRAASVFQWKIRPIPEDLRSDGEWVLRKAGDPHITQKKSRRVKTEKQITKKKRFPLGRAETETVDSWATEEWEEQIRVDPKVEITGWAETGDVLADIIEPDRHGEMGRSVYGKPIAVPMQDQIPCHPGQGVEISKTAVTALHDGFVRRGKDWVEVLPFQYHRWSVSSTKDRATCLLTFLPGKKDATPPEAAKILQAAEQKEFGRDELLPEEHLKKLLITAIHRQTPLKDYPISESMDAWFKVEASEDRLRGFLSIRKGGGKGKPLILKEVGAAIKKSGFKGMDFNRIKEDLLEFYRSRRTEMNEYVLAEGTPPTRGSDRELVFLCSFLKEDETTRLRDTSISIDSIASLQQFPLNSVKQMSFTRIGTVIAEITSGDPGDTGTDVYGNTLPGLPGKEPSFSLQENVLIRNNELVANEDGILDVIEEDDMTILRVRPYREARIEVEVTEDRMQAFISLDEAVGCAPPLTVDQVNALLEEKKVFKGIDSDALSQAILKAKEGESIRRLKIAEGNSPVQRENGGKLKFMIEIASGDKVAIKADGRADFRAHDVITAVEKDQLIAEIPPVSGSGSEGWDITGKPVKAVPKEQAEIGIGENIRRIQAENGAVRFYAEKSGELEYDGRNMSVHVSHHVNGNVDMKTGNVRFPGDVQVKGNVDRGFYVIAGGELLVNGTVEGALLSSGGSIQIAQGIIGVRKAVLRAKRNIRAQFSEEATLLAVGDIEIKNSCLRSHIKCNGTLRFSGDKATLIGGKIYTRHGLTVRNLGNDKGSRTVVSFGQDYLVADQIEQHEKEVQRLKDLVTTIDSQMKSYEQKGQLQSLEKARSNKLKYLKMMEKRSLRLFTLRERFEEHFNSKITVRGTLYPGVIIESHGRFHEVHSARTNVTVTFNQRNGRIEITENKKEE